MGGLEATKQALEQCEAAQAEAGTEICQVRRKWGWRQGSGGGAEAALGGGAAEKKQETAEQMQQLNADWAKYRAERRGRVGSGTCCGQGRKELPRCTTTIPLLPCSNYVLL